MKEGIAEGKEGEKDENEEEKLKKEEKTRERKSTEEKEEEKIKVEGNLVLYPFSLSRSTHLPPNRLPFHLRSPPPRRTWAKSRGREQKK